MMRRAINNLLRSGWKFNDSEYALKNRFNILNLMFIGNIIGLSVGMSINIIEDIQGLILIESFLLAFTFLMMYMLRKSKKYIGIFSNIIAVQYLIFFAFLVYVGEPTQLKHAWVFTYPLIILNLQSARASLILLLTFAFVLAMAPIQPYIDVKYTNVQIIYILLVLFITSFITYFYHVQITYAHNKIEEQRIDIEKKYIELSKKDSMLTTQSKRAVMGEMMTMIAHQWRQPLSTVTLSISNIQFKRMLGQEIKEEELDKALSDISDTVVYLSDTVDDFQTFFHPKKEKNIIEIHELIQKAVNFTSQRLKESNIEITVNKYIEIEVTTYINELVQILLNILNNAIDALVSTQKEHSKIIIYVEQKGKHLFISIVDNAGGIPKDIADKIFDPYFSTKGKNGTGLGLYMSKMLAQKQFDGDITFTSTEMGTHFVVKIKKDISS